MISTMCNDNNFERMPCDLRSRSLEWSITHVLMDERGKYRGKRIPFGIKRLHCEFAHRAEHQEGIFEEEIVRTRQ